jgi:hypothetical protein
MGELFLRDGYLMSRQRRQSGKESQRRGDYASRKLNDKNKGGEDEDDDDNDDDSDDDEDENEDNDDPSSQKQDRNGMHPRQGNVWFLTVGRCSNTGEYEVGSNLNQIQASKPQSSGL